MTYLNEYNGYKDILIDLINEDKSNQNIVIIDSFSIDEKSLENKKALLETVYDHSENNRFVFIRDPNILREIR